MASRKTPRRALTMSILSLLLCVSMLIGTTFAWFTDSVTSGTNIITAGNLDVELYHSDKAAPNGEKVTAKTVLFDDVTLWEPGAVAYENFVVANEGNLALKYQLDLNFDKATENEKGGTLADVLKVAVVKGGFDGDRKAAQALNYEYDLSTFTLGGELKGDTKSETYGVVVYWQPTDNDNDYNMNNEHTEVLTIDLGIHLFATQLEAESDSFGPDYDDNIWADAMVVVSEDDLLSALAAGETEIKLEADIALSKALEIPAGAELALHLNGKTISNEAGYIFENSGNLTIDGNGTATGLGIIRSTGGKVTINNGNFYASSRWQDSVYQHTLKAENSTVVINGGNFDATVKGQTNAMFNASENATITINGGNFKNVAGDLTQFDPYIFTYEKNGKVIINDGTFYGGWRFNGETTTTDIKGGTFTVGFDGQSFNANSTHVVTVSGGTFAAQTYAQLTDKVKARDIVAAGCVVMDNQNGTWTVFTNTSDAVMTLTDGAVLDLNGEEFAGTVVAEGNVTIMGDTKIKTLKATKSAKITIEEDKTLTMTNFSFGVKDNASAEYTITGGTVKADYGFFQHGKYTLNSDFETGYMYYSYGSDITVYGTFHSQGAGDGLDYVRGKLTIAAGGKSIHEKTLWVGQPEGWGAMEATLIVEEGGYVQAKSLNVYPGSSLLIDAANLVDGVDNSVKYDTLNVTGTKQYVAFNTDGLRKGVANAPVGKETEIVLLDGTYAGNIDITVAALGKSGGDVVIKAAEGATPVITGNVTLGYRDQGVGAAMYEANVTFEGITFDQAEAGKHSITVMDVKSLTLKNCTIIGDGEYGIDSARGNGTGASKIVGCTFETAGMQLLGNFATGLVIDSCTFNDSRINVQAGNGVTVQNCEFNNTLKAANVDDSFYAIRSNSTPITVKDCEINIDSELTEVASAQAKWYLLANRGTTNWTVENVAVTLTDAALQQTELQVTACTSTGLINTTNLTVNGVAQ